MIELKSQNGNDISFIYTGDKPHELRRFILAETQSYCFDIIEMQKNTSCLSDEILCLRLGLIMIQLLNLNSNFQDLKWILKVSGQSLGDSGEIFPNVGKWVINSDISPCEKIDFIFPDEIPIIYLYPEQEIECNLWGKIGKGKQHNKWCPVSGITYHSIGKNNYLFTMELTGILTWEQIYKQIISSKEFRG